MLMMLCSTTRPLHNMKSNFARRKAGFQGIEHTCEQATRDGISWAWVDTCSIDKTSSAELTEAINSMFKWYSEAAVCYAYLTDVPTQGAELQDLPEDNHTYPEQAAELVTTSFAKSRRFTRGWTLQELIAPLSVKFYRANWNYFGSNRSLLKSISRITGIEKELLVCASTGKTTHSGPHQRRAKAVMGQHDGRQQGLRTRRTV